MERRRRAAAAPAAAGAVPAARPAPQPPLRDAGEGRERVRRGGEMGRGSGACADRPPPAGVPARGPLAHQGLPAGPLPGGRLAAGLRAAHAGGCGQREAGPGRRSGAQGNAAAVAGGDAAALGAGPGPAAALPRLPGRRVPAAGGECRAGGVVGQTRQTGSPCRVCLAFVGSPGSTQLDVARMTPPLSSASSTKLPVSAQTWSL